MDIVTTMPMQPMHIYIYIYNYIYIYQNIHIVQGSRKHLSKGTEMQRHGQDLWPHRAPILLVSILKCAHLHTKQYFGNRLW